MILKKQNYAMLMNIRTLRNIFGMKKEHVFHFSYFIFTCDQYVYPTSTLQNDIPLFVGSTIVHSTNIYSMNVKLSA